MAEDNSMTSKVSAFCEQIWFDITYNFL
jgi:hypothetical protein